MVFRKELTYYELTDVLDTEYNNASSTRFTLPSRIHENDDFNLILHPLRLDDTEVDITIDDIGLILTFPTKNQESLSKKYSLF